MAGVYGNSQIVFAVKYFSRKTLKHIRSGSFRFGSLESYRAIESKIVESVPARFSDGMEGLSHINVDRLQARNVRIPGFDISGETYMGGSVITTEVRAYVFCCTWGRYDIVHHQKMLGGHFYRDLTFYNGNPEIDHYAVLDVGAFIEALDRLHPRNPIVSSRIIHRSVDKIKVSYNKGPTNLNYSGESIEIRDAVEMLNAVTKKPPIFEIERELRMVLRHPISPKITVTEDAAFVQSDTLARSIVELGKLELTRTKSKVEARRIVLRK